MDRENISHTRKQLLFMLKTRLLSLRRTHLFDSIKNTFSRSSSEEQPKKNLQAKNLLHLSRKSKFVVVFAIIAIVVVSSLAFIPKTKPTVEPQISDPTASPSPTNKQPPTQTTHPTQPPSSPLNPPITLSHVISGITEMIAPPKPAGLIESSQTINSDVWKAVAANAWLYFRPGIGVDASTGLPCASLNYPYFTDWDLGVYIQAIMDAQKIGLISADGDWGANSRLNKTLTFLESRSLNETTHNPFWFYQVKDAQVFHAKSDSAAGAVDVIDTGRLFVALNNLKTFNSSWVPRVNNFVYNSSGNRTNYAVIVPDIKSDSLTSTSIYAYYIYSGYASFWPNELADATNTILNNIQNAGNVTTNGNVKLPRAEISCEPLLCSVFELGNNSRLNALAKQVYLAHEARYNETGIYVAFSEGNAYDSFIYEWVVLPNNDTWKVKELGKNTYSTLNPIIYYKVALSFLSLYNTTYARDTTIYLERALPRPENGYCDGADFSVSTTENSDGTDYPASPNNAYLVTDVGSNTNGLILGASRYALQK